MKNAAKIIAYVLIVLAIVGIFGVIAKFTNGFTSDFKTFYVTIDGKDVMTTTNGYILDKDEPVKVDVKYTFSSSNAEVSGYSVKVIPNAALDKDFDFTMDGSVYSFQMEEDLTDGFIVEKSEDSFTIQPKGDITDILRAVYPESEIDDCKENTYPDMFSLVITSYNGESTVVVNFVVVVEPTSVSFDKEAIIF